MKIYRVIDDGTLCLTTSDPVKALHKLQDLFTKYDFTSFWFEEEECE